MTYIKHKIIDPLAFPKTAGRKRPGAVKTPTVYGKQVIDRSLPDNTPAFAVSKRYLHKNPEASTKILDSYLGSDEEDIDLLAMVKKSVRKRSRAERLAACQAVEQLMLECTGKFEESDDAAEDDADSEGGGDDDEEIPEE